ncbi:uncharacterized protein TRIADDRAFT_55969 [Trichoplax adhaerens]|uniref:C2H2-type domain-containing protein n=1 Tax=Trichoplax adhaerens TaxID=10228 RepID=B3RTL6_TRIAD|nr:predicted protein [Trichoplax adhaerens]EDV26150.1 predicted protein [Trichoplax adhaerens]|eukprot:XP_002112183.1 predicted protein [Trichoplax adhaerens]
MASVTPTPTNLKIKRDLELNDVMEVLTRYKSYDGSEIICCICDKVYKSRVCFTKHIWEHSVYWDTFDGVKNHERVLSIQAAIILCQQVTNSSGLVVAWPCDKKQREDLSPKSDHDARKLLPRKRKRELIDCSV